MPLDMGSHVVNDIPIRGLQQAPTLDDFKQACKDHKNLSEDDILLKAEKEIRKHLPQLELLFRHFGVQNLFGVFIPHKHSDVPDGFHLVGQTEIFKGRHYYWTKIVEDNILNPGEVCGRKFIFDQQQGLRPCEFHRGSPPDLSKVKPEFFLEFTNYLTKYDLTSILGLEYLVPELLIFNMLEFVLSNCGLLLVEAVFPSSNNLTMVTTGCGWPSDLPVERKTDCLKNPDGSHKPVEVKPKESHTSFDDVIRAFDENYLNGC